MRKLSSALSTFRGNVEYYLSNCFSGVIGDRMYLKRFYKEMFGKRLNLFRPKSFNEKMQWLKLYDRNPLYSLLADKYSAKQYLSDMFGIEYVIPLITIWDKAEDIDFESLPKRFVLKCTHDSSGVIICRNKDELDINGAIEFLNKRLKKNYFWFRREYAYKNIVPRVLCEEYMENNGEDELNDYKVWCFNGKAEYIQLDFDRATLHRINLYDTLWQQIPVRIHRPSDTYRDFDKPVFLNEMISIAEKVSNSFTFLRVDFFIINNRLFIGELTFYPEAGFTRFDPLEYNDILGKKLILPRSKRK